VKNVTQTQWIVLSNLRAITNITINTTTNIEIQMEKMTVHLLMVLNKLKKVRKMKSKQSFHFHHAKELKEKSKVSIANQRNHAQKKRVLPQRRQLLQKQRRALPRDHITLFK